MSAIVLCVLILAPFLAALTCFCIRFTLFRSLLIIGSSCALIASSLLLDEVSSLTLSDKVVTTIDHVITGGDFLLLGIMLYLGWIYRHLPLILLSAGQLFLYSVLEFLLASKKLEFLLFQADIMSLTLVRVVCIVGGLICLHAIPYMQNHEHHLQLKRPRQPHFFAVLLLFLGAMNGLALTNSLTHFYFFFELTTLCSFLLIRHDGTTEAKANSVTALWMNALGGLLLLLAIIGLYLQHETLDICALAVPGKGEAVFMLPFAMLIIAAFTKSAQFPFQKWLLGAMVAPTPTSALLHSSTMVKAGAYLALRFSPAFSGTMLAQGLLLAGGFTFMAAAILAMGQRNAKKVLAYSTISNLGLIFGCAGIGTPEAMTAGILLIAFHAVSKGLLFLCVGTAEQHLHSRDVEAMRGLCSFLPFTGTIAVVGILSLIVPPFGMLFGKWMVLETGADSLLFYMLLVVGSSCTLLYWIRLAGTLLTMDSMHGDMQETKAILTRLPLAVLASGTVFLGMGALFLYDLVLGSQSASPAAGKTFPLPTIGIAITVTGMLAYLSIHKNRGKKPDRPYMSGINDGPPGSFTGPLNQPVHADLENNYLLPLFGEARLTYWMNLIAGAVLLLLLGGGSWI